ncbi:oligopeptide ABC transporter substrate-binding protein [Miniphocaeibacter sp.]|uniref:oligopeptide ABC transporter substrate-binding protein n=1 Tax=Miniphocaeibacter sp. TaxID=3100973 RepID=UPI003BAFD0A0
MKKGLKILALSLALVMTLVACGGKNNDAKKETGGNGSATGAETTSFGTVADHGGEAIENGVVRIGVVADSPFTGVFSNYFNQVVTDQILTGYITQSMKIKADGDIRDEDEFHTFKFDQEKKQFIMTIKDTFKWSDGTPVTSRDFAFVYEIVGHPDYSGVRYDSKMQNIVGMEEYHNGEAETISGVETPDDKTLIVNFKEFSPSILWGAGIAYTPEPYHYLKDIPVKEMASHDKIRINPLSCGPYVITKVVPGEKVEYKRNEHYGAEVKNEGLVAEIISSANVLSAMKNGKYDLYTSIPGNIKNQDLASLEGYTTLQYPSNSFLGIGFKLGKWNAEKNEVEVDPNAKMADVNLRKAMAYALDIDAICDMFYEGLRQHANSTIIPKNVSFYDPNAEMYDYNPEKAKEILDEAGYKDVDGDGLREDPNGEKSTINYAAMSGGETAEPVATAYVQWWNEIGLDVQLLDGRLHEFNSFYERVQADDPDIDVYLVSWGYGTNPDPSETYSKYAPFNLPRYTDEKIEEALAHITSNEAFDRDYMVEGYRMFDKAIFDSVPVIPTMFVEEREVVNKRVKFYDVTPSTNEKLNDFGIKDIELTADKPAK